VRLRYFNVFGPRQAPGSPYSAVIPLFIEAMRAERSPVVHGDGLQSRDFTYVDDVVQANLQAMSAPRVAGKVYNIACGRRTSLLDLVERLNEILGTSVRPIHDKARAGDVRHSQADIAQAQVDLGYCPCTSLEQGLRHCLAAAANPIPDPVGVAPRSAPGRTGQDDSLSVIPRRSPSAILSLARGES
jgi:UDP-glucose 4-epimerase